MDAYVGGSEVTKRLPLESFVCILGNILLQREIESLGGVKLTNLSSLGT